MRARKLRRKFNKLVVYVEPDGCGAWDFEMAVLSVHAYEDGTDEGIEVEHQGDAESLHAALVQVLDRANTWRREGLLPRPEEPS